MIQPTNRMLLQMLLDFNTTELTTPFAMLFTNVIGPQPGLVYADLIEPTFTGYAKQALTVLGHRVVTGGAWQLVFNPVTFQPTANTSLPMTIAGWALVNSSGGGSPVFTLEAMELFDPGIPLNSDLSNIILTPILQLPPSAAYGMGLVA